MASFEEGKSSSNQNQKDDAWGKPAVVVGTANTPRSRDVQIETGVLRIPRNEREKREEENDEIPRSTHKAIEKNNRNPDNESPVETIPAESTQNWIPDIDSQELEQNLEG